MIGPSRRENRRIASKARQEKQAAIHENTRRDTSLIVPEQRTESQGFYYLSPRTCSELPSYRYSATDHSLTYKYVLSPIAVFLVENFTPRWVAPNAITLCGLGWMALSYCFMWYYCPHLDEGLDDEVPRWIFLFNFVAMLVYQTMDNMDGKQARRTNSSSPLGFLFDHGCDALNSVPGAINWAVATGLGFKSDPLQAWFVILCPMTLFYITTWEEFFTGTMVLPVINGPNEGLIAGAMFSLISFFWGAHYWHTTTWFDGLVELYSLNSLPSTLQVLIPEGGIRNVDFIGFVCVVWLVQEEMLKIFMVVHKYGVAALQNLLPYVFLLTSSTYIGAVHPDFLARNTRCCLHLVSALFSEMVMQLMLDHMSKESFNERRLTLIPLGLLVFLLETNALSKAKTDDFVLVYCVAVWMYLLMKVKVIINELCHLLQIWCFDVLTPYPTSEHGVGRRS